MSVLSYGGPAGAKQTRDLFPEVVQVEDVQNPPVVRVKLGKLNGDYGIEVYTAAGVLAFSSANNMFKIHATGVATVNLPTRSGVSGNQLFSVFTHNLGYIPMVFGMWLFQSGGVDYGIAFTDSSLRFQFSGVDGVQLGTQLGPVNCPCTLTYYVPDSTYNTQDWIEGFRSISLTTDLNTLYLKEFFTAGTITPLPAETIKFRYYIQVETGSPT